MAALPKLGSPALALLAVWSGGKKQLIGVDISNISTVVHQHRLFGVQAHFTFVECGIKRSSHAFCGRPTKLAQSLYCRCAPPTKSMKKQPNPSFNNTHILLGLKLELVTKIPLPNWPKVFIIVVLLLQSQSTNSQATKAVFQYHSHSFRSLNW